MRARPIIAAFAAIVAVPAAAGVQFVNAGLNVSTYGYVGDSSQPRFGSAFDSAFALRDLAATNSLAVTGPAGSDGLAISYAAMVDFRDAGRFVVTGTSDIAFSIATPGFVPAYGQTGASLFYGFTLDRSTPLTIDYAFGKTLRPLPFFGIGGDPARVFIFRSGAFPALHEFTVAPNSSGRFTATLAAGSYSFQLLTILNGGPGLPPGPGLASGRTLIGGADRFDVRLGAVPEPATWAMMILGFGLVGMAARRRPARVAA